MSITLTFTSYKMLVFVFVIAIKGMVFMIANGSTKKEQPSQATLDIAEKLTTLLLTPHRYFSILS